MNRRALLTALKAGAVGSGGLALAGTASAKSRTEDDSRYNARTGSERIDYNASEGFREEMATVARAVRATAVYEDDAPARVKALAGSPTLRNVSRGQAATMGEYRALIDAYSEMNPQAAASLKAQLSGFEPARDRDVNETGLGALGAGAAGIAALALTRGRTASVRRALLKQVQGAGMGAAGGAAGAAFANADQAVLSGDDAGDVGAWAAGGAAVGAGLAGGRSALLRTLRAASVRRQRLAQASADEAGPVFERRAMARSDRSSMRKNTPLIERDSDILAADVLHMERTLDAAGMPRVLTSASDVKDVARQLRREADFDGMQPALDELEGQYRKALKKLGVSQQDAPSLRHIDPYVTAPSQREGVEAGVKEVMRRRQRRRRAQKKRRANERAQ